MPEIVIAQRTDEWLAARIGKVTASLAAGCLGVDPYISPRKAWRTIIGTQEQDDNPFANRAKNWGIQFEAKARLDYETETGNVVTETGLWLHPVCDWLAASPDGLIDRDGLLECKCPTNKPSSVPVHHRIQMLIQLACTERAWCDYYAWAADGTFLARVHRAGIPGLIVRLKDFYEQYVLPGLEPPRRKRRGKKKSS